MGLTWTEIGILVSPYLISLFIGLVIAYSENKKQIRKLKRANKRLKDDITYYEEMMEEE